MEQNLIDVFDCVKQCEYKGRQYLVRDNGAVFRLQKEGGRASKWDNKWTFGKFDSNTGYLLISQERVHRIVCTAFHGKPVGDRNVVDHKDTNRSNNRPENLHWVSKMENIFNNPITMAKVELICGSKEAFMANPSLLFGHESKDPNFFWMRAVSPVEAKAAYERWLEWAKKPREERITIGGGSGPGEWIHDPIYEKPNSPFKGFQRWKSIAQGRTEDSFFPLAPLSTVAGEDVLQKYQEKLTPGAEFLISRYYRTVVREFVYFEMENKIRILTERIGAQMIYWYVFEIWPENGILIHKSVGNYGKNKKKDAEEALHDLTKFYKQEWRYKSNEPPKTVVPLNPDEGIQEIEIPEYHPREVKEYAPAENIEQRNWTTPTEFPMCPTGMPENPLEAYRLQMIEGDVFCRNRYGDSFLVEVGYVPEGDALIVLTNLPEGFKQWYLSGIYIENGHFIHESIGSFFEEDGGRKEFTIRTGGEWTGGDTIDDYC